MCKGLPGGGRETEDLEKHISPLPAGLNAINFMPRELKRGPFLVDEKINLIFMYLIGFSSFLMA